MNTSTNHYRSVDEYISNFPPHGQELLDSVRRIVREVAPEAVESIAYGMPAYRLNGPLVYFALYKNHLGLYPTPEGIAVFESELKPFRQGKGSVQFPLSQPLPLDLIRRIINQRVIENKKKAKK